MSVPTGSGVEAQAQSGGPMRALRSMVCISTREALAKKLKIPFYILDVENDCECDDRKKQPQEEPQTSPQSSPNWWLVGGAVVLGVGAIACVIAEPCGAAVGGFLAGGGGLTAAAAAAGG